MFTQYGQCKRGETPTLDRRSSEILINVFPFISMQTSNTILLKFLPQKPYLCIVYPNMNRLDFAIFLSVHK